MPKSYVGSRTLVLHDSEPCILPENGAILYAKTTDIPGVLTLVDVSENVAISYAKTTDIPDALILIDVSEKVANLYANPAIISKVLAVVRCQRTGRFCMRIR